MVVGWLVLFSTDLHYLVREGAHSGVKTMIGSCKRLPEYLGTGHRLGLRKQETSWLRKQVRDFTLMRHLRRCIL